jgi:dUTPase
LERKFVAEDTGNDRKLMLQMQIFTPEAVMVDSLPESVRGAGGFGSTGGFGQILNTI